MAFTYTSAGWEKARPTLLTSTGFGELLKKYEKAKKILAGVPADNLRGRIEKYELAVAAFDAVELGRTKAIKACGNSYKTAKMYLESAKPAEEFESLSKAIEGMVDGLVDEFGPKLLTLKKDKEGLIGRMKILEQRYKVVKSKLLGGGDQEQRAPLIQMRKKLDEEIDRLSLNIQRTTLSAPGYEITGVLKKLDSTGLMKRLTPVVDFTKAVQAQELNKLVLELCSQQKNLQTELEYMKMN